MYQYDIEWTVNDDGAQNRRLILHLPKKVKPVFFFHEWNGSAVHVFNPYIGPPLDDQDHLIYIAFFALDLHGYRSIPFISNPSGAHVQISSMLRSPSKVNFLAYC